MRLEHVYSADDERKFVNYIIKNLIKDVPEIELTSGTQRRDWIYIDDVVSAYIHVLRNINKFSASTYHLVEIGTGVEVSVREFVEMSKNIIGASTSLKFGNISIKSGELQSSHADTSILKELGWSYKYSVEEGIKEVIIRSEVKK